MQIKFYFRRLNAADFVWGPILTINIGFRHAVIPLSALTHRD